MEEKFEKEFDTHFNLIQINYAKITALDENFTKELAIHSSLTGVKDKKISALYADNQVAGMKIIKLESTLVTAVDKYFIENNNKIKSFIESTEIIIKNIEDLKTNLSYAYARIIILEDKITEK